MTYGSTKVEVILIEYQVLYNPKIISFNMAQIFEQSYLIVSNLSRKKFMGSVKENSL